MSVPRCVARVAETPAPAPGFIGFKYYCLPHVHGMRGQIGVQR